MADQVLVFNESNSLDQSVESFFEAPDGISDAGVLIKAFTASNNSTTSHWYKAYIYPASGANPEAIIPVKIVVRDKPDFGESIVGHVIPPGGSLRMETSTANGLNFYVTGQPLSSS